MKRTLRVSSLSLLVLAACSAHPGETTGSGGSAIDNGPLTQPGVYRPSTATWILSESTMPESAAGHTSLTYSFAYGASTDIPVSGQWTSANPGTNTIGVFRAAGAPYNNCGPNGARWLLRNGNGPGSPNEDFCYGGHDDQPLVGDWDGNGTTTVGVARPSWGAYNPCNYAAPAFILRNSNSAGSPDIQVCYGTPLDIPVAGDWDGNGTTTIGVFRPAGTEYNSCGAGAAEWLLRNSNTPGAPDIDFCYGGPGDVPLVGDWNNDGVSSIGVFRAGSSALNTNPSDEWLLRDSNSAGAPNYQLYYGAPGDIPVLGEWGPPPAPPPPPPPPPPPCVPTDKAQASWSASTNPVHAYTEFSLTWRLSLGRCQTSTLPISIQFYMRGGGSPFETITYSSVSVPPLPDMVQGTINTNLPDGDFYIVVNSGYVWGSASGVDITTMTPDLIVVQ